MVALNPLLVDGDRARDRSHLTRAARSTMKPGIPPLAPALPALSRQIPACALATKPFARDRLRMASQYEPVGNKRTKRFHEVESQGWPPVIMSVERPQGQVEALIEQGQGDGQAHPAVAEIEQEIDGIEGATGYPLKVGKAEQAGPSTEIGAGDDAFPPTEDIDGGRAIDAVAVPRETTRPGVQIRVPALAGRPTEHGQLAGGFGGDEASRQVERR